jgi:hypothetical protein
MALKPKKIQLYQLAAGLLAIVYTPADSSGKKIAVGVYSANPLLQAGFIPLSSTPPDLEQYRVELPDESLASILMNIQAYALSSADQMLAAMLLEAINAQGFDSEVE